jgi:Telomere resolvase
MNRAQLLQSYHDRIDQGVRQRLTTAERDFLVQDFIERLQSLRSAEAIEQLCRDEVALLEQGYGQGTNSTVNYLSKYRTAIALATEAGKLPMTEETSFMFRGQKRSGEPIGRLQHLAYDLMRYDNATYLANRKATNVGNNARQDHPQPFVPGHYLEKAAELLQSQEPETLAVGIAAVTGRRHTEVAVSGRFSATGHPYLLSFGGQLKKADPIAYTILTLLPAEQVLEAIDRFRGVDQVQALGGLTSADPQVAAFRARVNTRVKQHFQESHILPLLPGFKSVSVHRLRAAYARLAIHFWLPGQGVNEQRWLQFYLGHVALGEMHDAANSNSTAHYFGYCLVDERGKPITVTGIKLMANPLPSLTQQLLLQQQQANDQLDSNTAEPDMTLSEEDGMATRLDSIAAVAVDAIAADLQMLPDKQPQQLSATSSSTTPMPTEAATEAARESLTKTKRSKPRYRELRVNLADLTTAAVHLGIDAGSKSSYQALLDRLLLAVPVRSTELPISSLATPDPSALLAPLLQELAAIKQQVAAGQSGEELERLRQLTEQQQQEIDRLQAQLNQTQEQLQAAIDWRERVVQVMQGGELSGVELSPVADPAHATQTPDVQSQPRPLPHLAEPAAPAPLPQSRPRQQQLGRPSSGKLSPLERVPLAILALMHHNQLCSPAQRWFISGNVIATVAGANPALVVSPWLKAHPAAITQIDHHNTAIGLNARSNGKDKDRSLLKSIYDRFVEGKSIEELQHIILHFDQHPHP